MQNQDVKLDWNASFFTITSLHVHITHRQFYYRDLSLISNYVVSLKGMKNHLSVMSTRIQHRTHQHSRTTVTAYKFPLIVRLSVKEMSTHDT